MPSLEAHRVRPKNSVPDTNRDNLQGVMYRVTKSPTAFDAGEHKPRTSSIGRLEAVPWVLHVSFQLHCLCSNAHSKGGQRCDTEIQSRKSAPSVVPADEVRRTSALVRHTAEYSAGRVPYVQPKRIRGGTHAICTTRVELQTEEAVGGREPFICCEHSS